MLLSVLLGTAAYAPSKVAPATTAQVGAWHQDKLADWPSVVTSTLAELSIGDCSFLEVFRTDSTENTAFHCFSRGHCSDRSENTIAYNGHYKQRPLFPKSLLSNFWGILAYRSLPSTGCICQIIIHLRLGVRSGVFPPKTIHSLLYHTCYMPCTYHPLIFHHMTKNKNYIYLGLSNSPPPPSCQFIPLRSKYSP